MPPANLPDQVINDLEQTESGTINGTESHGQAVSTYRTSDGRVSVDVDIGLELDGVTSYKSISVAIPNFQLGLSLSPTLFCAVDDLSTFDPREDTIISIRVCQRRSFRTVTKSSAVAKIASLSASMHFWEGTSIL